MLKDYETHIPSWEPPDKEAKKMVAVGKKTILSAFRKIDSIPQKVDILMSAMSAYQVSNEPDENRVGYEAFVEESAGNIATWNFNVLFANRVGGRKPVKVEMFYNGGLVYETPVGKEKRP